MTPAGFALPAPDLTNAELAAWVAGYLIGWDRGRDEGYSEAYERVDRELVAALAAALAGDWRVSDYSDGLRRHERMVAAQARRAAADRGELADGAYAGGPLPWPAGAGAGR